MEIGDHGDHHPSVRELVVVAFRIRRENVTTWTNEGILAVRVAVRSIFRVIRKIVRTLNRISGSNNVHILIRPFLREHGTHGCLIPKPQIRVS